MRTGSYCGPATPRSPFESRGLGFSDFARHYFRNHGCFLFLQVLRWFTSLSSLDHPMYSDERNRCSHRLGFPIRKSPDHRLVASSRSLSQLPTSFIASLRQGIHTHALSSLTIKSISNTKYSTSMSILACAAPSQRQLRRLRGSCNTCSKYCPSNIQFSKIRLLRTSRSRKSISPYTARRRITFGFLPHTKTKPKTPLLPLRSGGPR
jgi:hypothetical protein